MDFTVTSMAYILCDIIRNDIQNHDLEKECETKSQSKYYYAHYKDFRSLFNKHSFI